MIEKLLALLERFVVAHERLAASQEALLQNCNCVTVTTDAMPAGNIIPAPTAAPAPAAKEEDSAPVAMAAIWNPFLEPLQGRYGKDKLAILDAEIATRGIELKASATGPEKHQALLDWSNSKKDELADALEAPAAPAAEPTPEPAAPAAEPAEEVTVEMVRAMAQKAMTGKGKLDAKAVQDLFEKHAGVRRLPEIPADKLAAVYAELQKVAGE